MVLRIQNTITGGGIDPDHGSQLHPLLRITGNQRKGPQNVAGPTAARPVAGRYVFMARLSDHRYITRVVMCSCAQVLPSMLTDSRKQLQSSGGFALGGWCHSSENRDIHEPRLEDPHHPRLRFACGGNPANSGGVSPWLWYLLNSSNISGGQVAEIPARSN
jgi:hypothetical protein